MKLKTNKLLTLTLASSLVAITACGGGGTKATNTTKGGGGGTPDPVTYSAWEAGVTQATVVTANAFLAGTAAVAAAGTTAAVDANLTGLPTDEDATILTLAYEVEEETDTVTSGGTTTKGLNAETLGGAATNGVGFATIGSAGTSRFFAGVIAGADLGAPLTTTTAGGTWNGIFQALGDTDHATEKAFVLNVNFADNEISAHIAAGTDADTEVFTADVNSYYLEGTFVTATGLITGNIIFGDYSAGADDAASLALAVTALETATGDSPTAPQTVGLGTLSGLIGTNGALGAFYSSGSDGQTATGFAGGFVATTADNAGGDDPDVVYADWAAGATQVATITDNAFLAGGATDLTGSPTGATITAINLNTVITPAGTGTPGDVNTPTAVQGTPGVQLGGDATNGVAFGTSGVTDAARFFAGLHNTTDLGAPLIASTANATFSGLFEAIGVDAVRKAFTLTVTFGTTDGNTIAGLIPVDANSFADDAMSYYLSGEYNAAGVITGNILYGDFSATATTDVLARGVAETALTAALVDGATAPATNGLGVLSGLIGTDGAVGAFYSNANGATAGYAGGFVASTDADAAVDPVAVEDYTPPAVVNYADWVPTSPALTAAATTLATAPTGNAFVHGVAAGLSLPSAITATPLGLDEGTLTGAATNGVAFGMNGATTAARFYAGILNGTTLGAPITSSAEGAWIGYFEAVGATGYATAARSITINVDFDDLEIDAHVPAGASSNADTFTTNGTNSYYLEGTFVAATGLITGTIIHGDYATGNADQDASTSAASTALGVAAASGSGHGTVTGLIGATGLVGAFISNATGAAAGYAGGFVAAPPATP